jgi:hypothetical protein
MKGYAEHLQVAAGLGWARGAWGYSRGGVKLNSMLEERYMPPKVCTMGGASRGIAMLLETAAGGQMGMVIITLVMDGGSMALR